MKIAVDAMGGDLAPEAVVQGTLLALPRCSADLILIGNEARIRKILSDSGGPRSVEVVNAPQSIGMGEAGPMAIRKKRDASLSVAMRLLAEQRVDTVISAGNTSAIVATARHFVGLAPGLRRPALAVPLPTPSGHVLLVDAGAHAEASMLHLAQSAALAHVYLKVSQKPVHPRIGLLNLGQEPSKGTRVIQRAFAVLERSGLNFVGNVEPYDLFADRTDAVVCDGFLGNVLLKMYEGLSETLPGLLEAQIEEGEAQMKEGLRLACRRFQEAHHSNTVGGAPLLGVRKPVVVAHGRSCSEAIASAVELACHLVKVQVFDQMLTELERDSLLGEMKLIGTRLMLESFKMQWGFTHK